MKLKNLLLSGAVFCLVASGAQAQNPDVEQLKKQLQQMQQNLEKQQRQHRQEMEALKKQIEGLEKEKALPPAETAEATEREQRRWQPTDPLQFQRGALYMDIGLVATVAAGTSTASDIEGGTQLGGHDPIQRGFTMQGLEVNFAGAVDPYFRGNANLLFGLDSDNDTFVELEEAYLETLALPANLQLRAGQFFSEFGRHNPLHLHNWAFADAPLVSGRFLGPDGLRNPGGRIAWLMPTPFYSELFLGIQNSQGATAFSFRSSGDAHGHGGEDDHDELPFAFRHADNDRGVRGLDELLFTPRYALSFDLTPSQIILLGASAALGPNSSGEEGDTRTQIYGVDLTWRWRPTWQSGGFPFVAWQTEGMLRRYKAGEFDWSEELNGEVVMDPATGEPAVLEPETLTDYGFYSQLLYGFRKGWVAGLRYDWVGGRRGDYEKRGLTIDDEELGRDPFRASRWRLSPNLTWYPSEFSKIRLQYNYDDRSGIGVDHSVWMQFEFVLGAHAAHKF